MRFTMANCSNLFFLSTLACKLAEVLSDKELAVLSANLVVLSDMLANILAQQELCNTLSSENSSFSQEVLEQAKQKTNK